jgi:peptide deformylase
MIRKTLQIGEKIIRQKAKKVRDVLAPETQHIIKDLTDSMRKDNLVGMAAPQIGKGVQIFITEVRQTTYRKNIAKSDSLRVFINPKLIWKSKKLQDGYEGCGSVASAQIFGLVKRSESIICEAMDKDGKPFNLKATGFLARIIQHEIDHLNGKVFLDSIYDTKTLIDRETYINTQKK